MFGNSQHLIKAQYLQQQRQRLRDERLKRQDELAGKDDVCMQELTEKLRKFKVADKELFKTKPVGNQALLDANQLKYRKANALRTRNEGD